MIFKEMSFFTKRIVELMNDDEYHEVQKFLLKNPTYAKVIKDSGGIRKLRWSLGTHGKSSGIRIIYYWYTKEETFLMLLVYRKSEADNLTGKQLEKLRRVVESELNN